VEGVELRSTDPSKLRAGSRGGCPHTTFAAEKERIFARSWQVVGHRDQVATPGDYFTTELVAEPLLIVRNGGLHNPLVSLQTVTLMRKSRSLFASWLAKYVGGS
jgi:hypothetical protein